MKTPSKHESAPRFPVASAGLAAALTLLLAGAGPAQGATRTWQGDYSGYWSAAQNWAENIAPTDGDDLVFPAGAALLASTNNVGNRPFRSITLSGSGHTLRGLSSGTTIGLTHGLSATHATGSSTVELDLDLGASQSFECASSAADLYLTGNIDLATHTLTTVGAGEVRLGGVISGSGDLTKTGSGDHRLYGSAANSLTGVIRVNTGTLLLAKTSGNAIPFGAELIVGDGLEARAPRSFAN